MARMRSYRGYNFVVFEIGNCKEALGKRELMKAYQQFTENMNQEDRIFTDKQFFKRLKPGRKYQYELRQWTGIANVPQKVRYGAKLYPYLWVSYAIQW